MRSWCGSVIFAAVISCARGRWNPSQRGHCPGDFHVAGHGRVSLVPTGWGDPRASEVEVRDGGVLVPHMGGRAYFADTCTGVYSNEDYLALNLVGKTMRYTVDLRGTGCGCNVAFYLVPMKSNQNPSECMDYYCDANDVCGESCAEIDIMEANMHAFHSTLHTQFDHEGFGGGFGGGDGWNGPRDWNTSQFGPGSGCIDTMQPFSVTTSFPADGNSILRAVEVVLSQEGHDCQLSVRLSEYPGMADLSSALSRGMTPVVSYWSSDKMLWLDGPGVDGKGPCTVDLPDSCPDTAKVYNFSIEEFVPSAKVRPEPEPVRHNKWSAHKARHHPAQPKPLTEDCPGDLHLPGHGPVSIVPAGWGQEGAAAIEVESGTGALVPHLSSRSYFADSCTAGKYDHKDYLALNLLGKKMSYTVNVSGAGCGCNVAFYLVSMNQNEQESTCGDYYCDANSVCGVPCAEIDIMEANERAWHTTLHTEYDHEGEAVGLGGGKGWVGPRDFATWEYGPWGSCINTKKPFDVEVSFPLDSQGILSAVELRLKQEGSACHVAGSLTKYKQMGMSQLTVALAKGMTPTVSYWSSEKMLWLDGQGSDGQGACYADFPDQCGESVRLSNFAVEKLEQPEPEQESNMKRVCIDGYLLQPECVIEFEYKGRSVVGCTKSDAKTLVWCSRDAKYQHRWSQCQPCEVSVAGSKQELVKDSVHLEHEHVEPVEHVEHDAHAKPEKTSEVKAQLWAQCGGVGYTGPTECASGATCQFMNDWWSYCVSEQSHTGKCFDNWKPHPDCALHFTYDDTEFTGCTDKDNGGQGWCSPDAKFAGRRLECTPCNSRGVEVHILQKFLKSTGLLTAKTMAHWGTLLVAVMGVLGVVASMIIARRHQWRTTTSVQYATMLNVLESRHPGDDDLEARPEARPDSRRSAVRALARLARVDALG